MKTQIAAGFWSPGCPGKWRLAKGPGRFLIFLLLGLLPILPLAGTAWGEVPPSLQWQDVWDVAVDLGGSTAGHDYANAVAAYGSQVYVAGRGGRAGLGGDWLVQAYNTRTGAPIWTNWLNSGTASWAFSIAATNSQVFAGGYVDGANGYSDWLVRAYNAQTGTVQWSAQWGLASGTDVAHGVAVSGNYVFVAGEATNATGNSDWVVKAFSTTGVLLWTDQWDLAGGQDTAVAVKVDPSGKQVYVMGYGRSAGGNDVWMVRAYKVANTKKIIWSKTVNLAGGNDYPTCMAVRGNALYVGGSCTNTAGNPDWVMRSFSTKNGLLLPLYYTSAGRPRIRVPQYNDQVNLAGANDSCETIAVLGNKVYTGGTGINASGKRDWLIRVYNSSTQTLAWLDQISIGGTDNFAHAMTASILPRSLTGYLFVAGGSKNASNENWVVRAYNASTGALQWKDIWDRGTDDRPHAIAAADGRVFVVGHSINAANNSDWVVRAYLQAP